jgi:small subunit ribosomal protein S16
MLKLRLKRGGRKKKPFYKIVLINNKTRRDGGAIQELGHLDSIKKIFKIHKPQIIKHLKNGAQPSLTVKNLLKKMNIMK